jgi:large subunit ribosomal protein L30
MSGSEGQGTLRIRLVKSPIGYSKRQRRTLQALGLRRVNSSVVQADTPAIRGMVSKVNHLIEVEEVEEE